MEEKKKEEKRAGKNPSSGEEGLTRRTAFKRIAFICAGTALVAGENLLGRASQAKGVSGNNTRIARYISIEGSYVNTVYVDNQYTNRSPSYNDYVSYYTSYNSHSAPPRP